MGYRVDPGESFTGSLQLHLDAGSYRVLTEVFGGCCLGAPKSISAREIYFGEFRDCAIWDRALSVPFGAE